MQIDDNILDFNAIEALKLARTNTIKLKELLQTIKKDAKKEKTRVFVYETLSKSVIEQLETRGFIVEKQPSIAVQKDNLHYIIKFGLDE